MKSTWKILALTCGLTAGCLAAGATPARAQGLSFGYAGPGVSVGVTAGAPGYYGGYYGPGYYPGYRVVTPGPVVVGPAAPILVRPPVVLPGPWVRPGGYVVRRPYGWYGPYPRYYRRWW
jgi:hypothetical protein